MLFITKARPCWNWCRLGYAIARKKKFVLLTFYVKAVVGPVLRTMIDIQAFDFSYNKLEKPEVINELKTFIDCSSCLNSLSLAGCHLSAEFLEEILAEVVSFVSQILFYLCFLNR